jgi:hypothetical protein
LVLPAFGLATLRRLGATGTIAIASYQPFTMMPVAALIGCAAAVWRCTV